MQALFTVIVLWLTVISCAAPPVVEAPIVRDFQFLEVSHGGIAVGLTEEFTMRQKTPTDWEFDDKKGNQVFIKYFPYIIQLDTPYQDALTTLEVGSKDVKLLVPVREVVLNGFLRRKGVFVFTSNEGSEKDVFVGAVVLKEGSLSYVGVPGSSKYDQIENLIRAFNSIVEVGNGS